MSARELKIIKKFLNEHLQKKFIQISILSAAALILLVKKSEKNIKMCINYKKLNALISRNYYLIFLIHKTLNTLCNAKYYMKMNIIVTFNKLRMTERKK